MSPEKSATPLSPQEQALTPRMLDPIDMDSVDVVQEAEPTENHNGLPQSNASSTPLSADDDLTSLSWLQDRNLLKGINKKGKIKRAIRK